MWCATRPVILATAQFSSAYALGKRHATRPVRHSESGYGLLSPLSKPGARICRLGGTEVESMPTRSTKTSGVPVAGGPVAPSTLLEKAAQFYHGSLPESDTFTCLRKWGLGSDHLITTFEIGYCTGKLSRVLPSDETSPEVRSHLTRLGLLTSEGNETLLGMITVPIRDPDGGTVGVLGLDPATGKEHLTGNECLRIWNAPAALSHADLVAAVSALDALSLAAAGIPNVIAFIETPQKAESDLLTSLGVASLTFVADPESSTPCAKVLDSIRCFSAALPKGRSPSDFLKTHGPEKLVEALDAAERTSIDKETQGDSQFLPDGLRCLFNSRRYEVRGIEKLSRRLKAAVRAERQGRLHVDTVDFYSSRNRRNLCIDLCRFFEESREVIDADIDRLIRLCERWVENRPDPSEIMPSVQLTERDIKEAEELGKAPDLINKILADYEACGLVGEEHNKLLCYLAAVSRRMDEPLSVLILSSSGAGKSALQDATIRLCPPEDIVKVTSMTGRALFYKGRNSLKHKILAIEEEAGAEGAAYPLRALISSGELIVETTVKDLGSGRLTTVQNKVEGPCAVFITTTSPDADPETRSRFFVTSVDESRAQTRRILDFQRSRRTLAGQSQIAAQEAVILRHRNFQRLLKPLAVVNPFADSLKYDDDRLQSRRNQPKLLNLIAAVAFLRQMTKEIRTLDGKKGNTAYIDVDSDDMHIAHSLAERVLHGNVDDLNPVSSDLLCEVRRMIAARVTAGTEEGTPERPEEVVFTRRELREFSGWPHTRVRRYLVELVDMEFITKVSGRTGSAYRYRLACPERPGQPGQTWSLGENDVKPWKETTNAKPGQKS